jgi:PHD/YefM family antitoxin component YafN of YafNO toxin-antitoxin module
MEYLSISNLKQRIHKVARAIALGCSPVGLKTKYGNVVLISEEELRGREETLYLKSQPATYSEIVEGMATSLEECEELEL